jgi:hypothetical protein
MTDDGSGMFVPRQRVPPRASESNGNDEASDAQSRRVSSATSRVTLPSLVKE